jgi:hypothetical protein
MQIAGGRFPDYLLAVRISHNEGIAENPGCPDKLNNEIPDI